MSQNFLAFPLKPYIGRPFSNPMELGRFETVLKNYQLGAILGTGAAGKLRSVPKYVPINIAWLTYGASTAVPNVGVLVDLSSDTPGATIEKIQSVYIDNTNSVVPIYIVFPDSGHVVVAQPFSAGWHPAITQLKIAWIFGKGFTDGQIPTTTVFFTSLEQIPYTNLELPQTVQLWKSSALIQRGNSIFQSNYAVPALGDQTQQFNLPLTSGLTQTLFGSPLSAGFIYVTALTVFLTQFNTGIVQANDSFTIESTGVSGVLITSFFSMNGTIPYGGNMIYSMGGGGMNVKIDGTQTWRIRLGAITIAGFALVFSLNYTTNPT